MKRSFIFYLLLLTPCVYAADPATIQPNQVYSSTGKINFRTEPPKTMFYILGDKKGLLNQNDKVTVKNVKEVNTLFNKYYWLDVERVNPVTKTIEKGWIYGGKAGSQSMLEVAK